MLEPLAIIPAVSLCGGAALYLPGHTAFWLRDIGLLSVPRLAVAAAALSLLPVALLVSALAGLAALVALFGALAAAETIYSPLGRTVR